MRTSLNPLMYNTISYSRLIETAGTYELLLSPGTYYMALCGGGGAGGNKGANSYKENQAGGNGGAGGTASVVERTVQIPTSMRCLVYVGDGGRTSTNGGNGGVGGGSGGGNAGTGGSGGGGGMPTYIQFAQQIDGDMYIVSEGGGGGGGGCGGTPTAGGGGGGTANGHNYNSPGGNATNYRTAPLSSTNYLGQPSNLGRGGVGQTLSQAATNGYNGWFYILKFQESTPLNLGGITDTTDNTFDCGGITDPVENILEMGQIA